MVENEDDQKYQDIIKTLRSLQKVSAPSGFEADLMRRINAGNHKEKKSLLPEMLSPSRLIPAAVAAAAVIIFFFFSPTAENAENPLMTDPRVREEMASTQEVETVTGPESYDAKGDAYREKDSFFSLESERYIASAANRSLFINKSGLNFRQIRLTGDEREQLNKLKARIKSFLSKP